MSRKNGRDRGIINNGKGSQTSKRPRIFDQYISMEDMKSLMKSEKE